MFRFCHKPVIYEFLQNNMCSEEKCSPHWHSSVFREKGWYFQSNTSLLWLNWIFTEGQALPFQLHLCEAGAPRERARQTLLIQRHLAAPATWSKSKLSHNISTHRHTKPALCVPLQNCGHRHRHMTEPPGVLPWQLQSEEDGGRSSGGIQDTKC